MKQHAISLVLTCLVIMALIPSTAWADVISVAYQAQPEALPFGGSSRVRIWLDSEIESTERSNAFVGITIKAGVDASCASNYAQDLESPNAHPVLTNVGMDDKIDPEVDSGTGLVATVPGGAWSLCGWVEPEGDTLTARPSATDGPVRFTVAGPEGTTSLGVPVTVSAGAVLAATVKYAVEDLVGEIPGTTTASLYVEASHGPGGCAPSEMSFQQLMLNAETRQASIPIVANQPGTTMFEAALPTGVYSLCAYMRQTFPFDNTPGILAPNFGMSSGITAVAPSTTLSSITPSHAGHGMRMPRLPRLCAAIRDSGSVAVIREAGLNCTAAHSAARELIRKIGGIGRSGSRARRVAKIASPAGGFVCNIHYAAKYRYSVTCAHGGAMIAIDVTR